MRGLCHGETKQVFIGSTKEGGSTPTAGKRFLHDFPQRTNNILEKILKAMPANTPLVKNLNNPQYMRILLDGKATLEERFAQIDASLIRKELAKLSANSDKVPPRIKKLIRQPDFPGQLVAIFAG